MNAAYPRGAAAGTCRRRASLARAGRLLRTACVRAGWLLRTACALTAHTHAGRLLLAACALTACVRADVLDMPDGTRITTATAWRNVARPQVLDFFARNVYGAIPPRPASLRFELVERGDDALDGLARRRQYRIRSQDACGEHAFDVLVYLPKRPRLTASGGVPAFVCPNFSGNHSITPDPKVILPTCPIYGEKKVCDAARGQRPERIPVRDIVARGFAIATFCHCDVYPDYAATRRGQRQFEAVPESVWAIFPPERRTQPMALTAWAWGNMRVLDLLETLPEIDARHVAVVGQSRLAKVAVITAACDERFAMCCPNAGGCKTLTLVPNLRFPAWFLPQLTNWTAIAESGLSSEKTRALGGSKAPPPFDQAALLGCIAPRPIHFGASAEDIYAPPDVHFEAVRTVAPVYRLFGATRFPGSERMRVAEPFVGDLSWHCKPGPHAITRTDWQTHPADAAEAVGGVECGIMRGQ